MPASFSHMINVKLTQENYLLLKTQILPYLRSQGLLGYIDGSIPQPSQTIYSTEEGKEGEPHHHRLIVNPEYTVWYVQDQFVLSGITASVTEEVLGLLVGVTTSRGAWRELEKTFAASSRARIMQIRMQLATTQKKDATMADYYRKMKRLADTLAAIGKRLEDEEFIAYLLRGLGAEYDSLVTSITTRVDAFTVSDIYAHMLNAELRNETNQTEYQVSANMANRNQGRGGGGRNNRGRGRNTNNGRAAGVRRPTQGGSSSGGGGNKIECQVCGRTGHDALRCWYRFDHSYQADDTKVAAAAASNSYAVDPNWCFDSGATDHLTNNLERLTTRDRYHGGDQVQVANGSGSNHEGNSAHRKV